MDMTACDAELDEQAEQEARGRMRQLYQASQATRTCANSNSMPIGAEAQTSMCGQPGPAIIPDNFASTLSFP